MEPELFNNFVCNVAVADGNLRNQVKCQSIAL